MINKWIKPMIDAAGRIDSGLGFYCHAFPQTVLQNPEIYRQAEEQLASNLRKLGAYAQSVMNHPLCIEQMYTPHQIPWTIQGTKNLLRALHKTGESVYYITIDTGHQTGQKKYRKPDIKTLKNYLLKGINN